MINKGVIFMELNFTYITQELINHIKLWHEDEETNKRIGIDDIDEFYSYVKSRLDYFIWVVSDNGELVGELCVELTSYRRAAISYIINPSKRNRGYCLRMLREMINLKELSYIEYFDAWVDSDNYPSIKCLEQSGFTRQNQDPEDNNLLHYVLKIPRN